MVCRFACRNPSEEAFLTIQRKLDCVNCVGGRIVKKAGRKKFCLCPRVFFCFFFFSFLFFFVFVCADSVDMNSLSVNGAGVSASDTNFFTWATVGQGIAGNASSTGYNTLVGFYYDNIAPTTYYDYNASWQASDQNVQFNCVDDDSGCKLFSYSLDDVNYFFPWGNPDQNIGIELTTDANHHIVFFSNDYMDNNERAREIYASVDKNAPTIVITGPVGITIGTRVVFSFLATAVSGIKKYWVKIDSGNWIDNSTATTYPFSISPADVLPQRHVFYVKATGNSDLNSNVESRRITFESASGSGIVTISEGPVWQPQIIIEQQILSVEKSFPPLGQPNIPVLDETEKQPDLAKKRFATEDELDVKRTIRVYALIGENGVISYGTKITVTVENIGLNTLSGIEVIEGIDKNIIASSDLIRSRDSFEVIENTPAVLRFVFGDLDPGQKKSVLYDFNRSIAQGPVTKEMLDKMKPPTALVRLLPNDLCLGAQCNDFNPCTRDYCVRGECRFVLMNDGAKCGFGLVCEKGKCVSELEQAGTVVLPVFVTRFDYLVLIALVFGTVFAFVLQFTLRRFLKKKLGKGKN